jgi:hypothetical protein
MITLTLNNIHFSDGISKSCQRQHQRRRERNKYEAFPGAAHHYHPDFPSFACVRAFHWKRRLIFFSQIRQQSAKSRTVGNSVRTKVVAFKTQSE